MSFSVVRHADHLIVGVEGQLVAGNREELKRLVLDEMSASPRRVRIDFRHATYLDSAGLGVLVSLSKHLRTSGAELRLANPSTELKNLFELTKLDTLFTVEETDDDDLSGRSAPIQPTPRPPLRGEARADIPQADGESPI